ncbi:bifunctional adenosylcobinamide kinase/adenosylcobinamide-phosphate guanylyltransferase [Shewanella sp.]|uniref:bifunctional adenosylcobinamide kinase/adenosylcobinamide-phosphate guanylyltransferase n=1 Tax=Shewanella sp. TaxID=50422 RepID=UPI00356354A5
MIHLVLGGARSGKSRFGEHCVRQLADDGIYLATALAGDDEMHKRIKRHQEDRANTGVKWQLIEEHYNLSQQLEQLSTCNKPVLVDCLTLWLSQCLVSNPNSVRESCHQLIATLAGFQGQLILISNEVGSGIVPLGELSRQFVDEAGWLNQAIAALANRVTLVVAGLPLSLKDEPVKLNSNTSLPKMGG